MTMFYIADRFGNRFRDRSLRLILEVVLGWTSSARWLDEVAESPDPADLRWKAERDFDDVVRADVVICMLSEPRSNGRGARHAEFGIALAKHKRIILIGDQKEHIFHYLDEVEHFPTFQETIDVLLREKLDRELDAGLLAEAS